MTHTLFEYLYRDAGNFKAHGAVLFEGSLEEHELARVRTRFGADGLFIAEQIGIPPLYVELYRWSDGPTRDDHCWHELWDIRSVEKEEYAADIVCIGRIDAFVNQLAGIKEWREELSPHFPVGAWDFL